MSADRHPAGPLSILCLFKSKPKIALNLFNKAERSLHWSARFLKFLLSFLLESPKGPSLGCAQTLLKQGEKHMARSAG